MAREVVMPKLGLTMSEGVIAKWYVSEGDSVKEGDKLMSVETDKLTNEVISDVVGIVRLILVPEGSVVPVKEIVAVVGDADEDISQYKSMAPALDAGNESEEVAVGDVKEASAPLHHVAAGENLATPYAKHIAKEKGISLSDVSATGYNGVIVSRDVLDAEKSKPKMTGAARNAAALHGVDVSEIQKTGRIKKEDILARISAASLGGVERVKASSLRKTIAKNMLANWNTSPMVTFDIDVEMDEMIAMRTTLNEEYKELGVKISYNHIFAKILSKLLLKHRELNAYFDGQEIEYHNYVNIGLAVAIDAGLVVPNLKNAETMDLVEISVLMDDLVQKARNGGLQLDEMQGGTFTITNLGMYGLKSFTPIINKPEVAILGVSAIRDDFRLEGEDILVGKVATFSLTADHSLVDGAVAGAFLKDFKKYVENPYLML